MLYKVRGKIVWIVGSGDHESSYGRGGLLHRNETPCAKSRLFLTYWTFVSNIPCWTPGAGAHYRPAEKGEAPFLPRHPSFSRNGPERRLPSGSSSNLDCSGRREIHESLEILHLVVHIVANSLVALCVMHRRTARDILLVDIHVRFSSQEKSDNAVPVRVPAR